MKMHRRTTVGLKLLMLFVAVSSFLISPVLASASEVDSLLNSSHVTSWAYYRDPGQSIWYISEPGGTTYGLGRNNSGHASWVAIANQGPVANLDFLNKKVSLSSSTAALTPSDSYLAISLVYGEANEIVYGPTANQWANLIAGKTCLNGGTTCLNMEWYFFRVESTGIWYIILVNGTDSTILRLGLNAAMNQYDWQKPLDASGVGVDTANWTKTFFQENGIWKVRFTTANPIIQFLSFPLHCGDGACVNFNYSNGAYTSIATGFINSVLDHSMSYVYDYDGKVVAFTGEYREGAPIKQGCYPTVSGSPISVDGLYRGTSDCSYTNGLNYEGHPGYDFYAESGMPVYSAAAGYVVNYAGQRCIPKGLSGCEAWGFIGIDHGNGYVTQYGHLSRIDKNVGDHVYEGEQIGLSGNTAPVHLGAHLHFEVLKAGSCSLGYCVVDPYGWEGDATYGADPLAQVTGITNVRLWK